MRSLVRFPNKGDIRKGWLTLTDRSRVQSVHHGREVKEAEPQGDWSHIKDCQEAEMDGCWHSVHFNHSTEDDAVHIQGGTSISS